MPLPSLQLGMGRGERKRWLTSMQHFGRSLSLTNELHRLLAACVVQRWKQTQSESPGFTYSRMALTSALPRL
jgi:hypothetical protein